MDELKIGIELAIEALVAYWVLLLLAVNSKNEIISNILIFLMFGVMLVIVILSADFIVGMVLFFGIFVVPKVIGSIFSNNK
ncbi:hypothetical protein [Flavobacterium weaverense]|uniref:Uncharacterized protein n=1 Tax=Flavobacterium weaverense TaxID=271156 RepID=A0A3L9ZJ18_9FLAO|nr:hypothetical protein [Flavobacterium weaverense]RMA72566.1 hypothetical protein BC961_2970 [Flavobacterium weaverense]